MRKRPMITCLSVLAAAALAGGAYAETRSSPAPISVPTRPAGVERSFINDVAKRLHVTPGRLTAALEGAAIDQVAAEAKACHLSTAQADAFKQRVAHSLGLPFGPLAFGFGPLAFGFGGGPMPPPIVLGEVKAPGFFGPPAALAAAASYLGVSESQLMQELRSGKETLAQIAQARGRSTSGLEQAMITALKTFLQRSAAGGRVPQAMQQKLLASLRKWVQAVVTTRGAAGRPFALSLSMRASNARIHVLPPGNMRLPFLPGNGRVQVPLPRGNVTIQSPEGPPCLNWMIASAPLPQARAKAGPPGW